MKRKTRRNHEAHLAPDDRVLWNRVTRTVPPLPHVSRELENEAEWRQWLAEAFPDHAETSDKATLMAGTAHPGATTPPVVASEPVPAPTPGMSKPIPPVPGARKAPPGPGPLDDPAWRKLARGRVPIDASIDLHHLNQDEAFHRLHAFLVQARARGCRHVLVITGKGSAPTSDGVLRRMLPVWVAMMPFSHIVGALRPAGRGHGGDGAFYLRLRKTDEKRLSVTLAQRGRL